MYKTLAFRNMKRQLRNYLVYFVTIAMTISLVFAINNLIYNADLQDKATSFDSIATGLLVLSIFLCIIIAIVLGYANAFILRLRKREFGTYLTVGMKRKHLVKLFLLENSFLGIFAIGTGFILGSLLYQALMLLMSKLLDYKFAFTFVSIKGVVATLIMTILIFFVTFISSSIYLKRVTIYELIHGENKVQQVQRKPIFSMILTILSAVAIVYSLQKFSFYVEETFKQQGGSEMGILAMIALLAIALILFHFGLAKSLMYVLLQTKLLPKKGTNQFVLRQLSASLSANALLLGLLSFLIAFSIIATNTGLLYKAIEEEDLEKRYPFDVSGNETHTEPMPISPEKARSEIEKYTTIKETFETPFFTTGEVEFLKLTPWYDEFYTDTDVYVRQSDFNELLEAVGEASIQLENEYAIYANTPVIKQFDFSQQTIEKNGQHYHLKQIDDVVPAFVWAYFVIVVPDEVVEGMELFQTSYAWNVEHTDFDATALNDALYYEEQRGNFTVLRSDYRVKEYQRENSLAFSAIFIVGALYLGFVFILLAMAILALKTLSGISDDEKRYRILYRIGVSKEQQTTTLAKQILAFFAFPVVIPVILALPVAIISRDFIALIGLGEQLSMMLVTVLIMAVIVIMYFIYFIVTFMITKKHVIE